ncbi:hypothetical protein A2U01_0040545, partial [Trifolium medium]|nr:hypothetical protein [Trifolium medium]
MFFAAIDPDKGEAEGYATPLQGR